MNRITFLKTVVLGALGIASAKEVVEDKLTLEVNDSVQYLNPEGDTYDIADIEWSNEKVNFSQISDDIANIDLKYDTGMQWDLG